MFGSFRKQLLNIAEKSRKELINSSQFEKIEKYVKEKFIEQAKKGVKYYSCDYKLDKIEYNNIINKITKDIFEKELEIKLNKSLGFDDMRVTLMKLADMDEFGRIDEKFLIYIREL